MGFKSIREADEAVRNDDGTLPRRKIGVKEDKFIIGNMMCVGTLEMQIYNKYKGKITVAFKKDIFTDQEGNYRCGAKRTKEREKYIFKGFKLDNSDNIVLIECPPDVLVIEFEQHSIKPQDKESSVEQRKQWIQQTKKKAEEKNLDVCIVSHGGTSDYVYLFNLLGLPEGQENEAKKILAKAIVPEEAQPFLDWSNLGKTLIPVIGRPHWKENKYKGTIHKIIEGKNPTKHKNNISSLILQKLKPIEEREPKQNEAVTEIKQQVSLVDIMQKLGFDLSKNPTNCIWHESKSKKCFSYDNDLGLWHCFHCSLGGDVISLVMTDKKLDFKDALDWIEKEVKQSNDKLNDIFEKIKNDKDDIDLVRKYLMSIINKDPLQKDILVKRLSKVVDIKKETLEKELAEYERQKTSEETREYTSKLDDRFRQKELLVHIWKELDQNHKLDDREKLATFLIAISGYLPNPKNHTSGAFKGDSSAGKDNIQLSALKHIPKEDWASATRITQSEMEDRIESWKILMVSEINRQRENGANIQIVETFKQVIEDGIRIFKKDNVTGESKKIEVSQKTGFYGTTETESDDELETRYIVIPIRGYPEKNKTVVYDILDKSADLSTIARTNLIGDSWIARSIRALNKDLDVVIPFGKKLREKIKVRIGKEDKEIDLFDFSKERIKRDVKRLMSLTKAMSWLFQEQRDKIEYEGRSFIVAEPSDFTTTLEVFAPFFNLSYSGLDFRIQKTLDKIKKLIGNYSEIIENRLGKDSDKSYWVIRSELQKELDIHSVDTIKKYVDILKDKGLVKTFWSNDNPHLYLIYPTNDPTTNMIDPNTLVGVLGVMGGWKGGSEAKKWYKKKEFIDIILPETLLTTRAKERASTFSDSLVGTKSVGSKSYNVSPALSVAEPKRTNIYEALRQFDSETGASPKALIRIMKCSKSDFYEYCNFALANDFVEWNNNLLKLTKKGEEQVQQTR